MQGVLASGGEDHLVVVWDLNRTKGSALSEGAPGSSNKGKQVVPPEVMFKHVGHRQGVRSRGCLGSGIEGLRVLGVKVLRAKLTRSHVCCGRWYA